MRRKFWILILSVGVVAGFAVGFARLHHFREHGHPHFGGERFERHVADLCTEAAVRAYEERSRNPGKAGP
jgi:hypothetical protein